MRVCVCAYATQSYSAAHCTMRAVFVGFYVVSIPAAMALAFSADGGIVGMWTGIDIGYSSVALALLVRGSSGGHVGCAHCFDDVL